MDMIDIYDDLRQKTGETAENCEVHRKGLIHKGICVWILNSNNEVLLQRRASDTTLPDMLDISFSGHVKSGETAMDAVFREGKEELGFPVEQYRFLDGEVQDAAYIPLERFRVMVENKDASLVPYESHYDCFLSVIESRLVREQ